MNEFTHDNSFLRVCVDRLSHHTAAGRVFSRRLVEPMEFEDMSSLFLRLEQLFDRQNFPQAFQRTRAIVRDTLWQDTAAADPAGGMSGETVNAQRGALATFEILILSRRNATWQGRVDWLDGSEAQEFSGSLELLRLIDAKLTGSGETPRKKHKHL